MPVVEATEQSIRSAQEALLAGEIVAFPTETVYGLGADARQEKAIAKIYEAKGRPRFNPLIVHVGDLAAAQDIGEFSDLALTLARAFWPGPSTLVLPIKSGSGVSELVCAGLQTVGLRVPRHRVAQSLLSRPGLAVAAPSANRSGHVSATRAEHVASDLGDHVQLILDDGPVSVGVESTILRIEGGDAMMLRAGGITRDDIEKIVGRPILDGVMRDGTPQSPGQLLKHYAPSGNVRLNARAVRPGEAFLGFGPEYVRGEGAFINLSETGDLREAAANFFGALRALDASGATTIAVAPIPNSGLGEAINDRLQRAAAANSESS